ncbi:hypothetical protein DFH09DRAFT_1092572 [Mycena vulgaris]|nr:hypothetical protein DFH09DRAFT_1092572 [Mycena vulgaris]
MPHTHEGRAALCTNSTLPATQHFAVTVLDTLLDPIHLACSNNSRYRSFGGQSPTGKTRPLYQLDPPSTTDLPAIHATRLPDTNPMGESPLELHPSGDKLTRTISPRGTHTTTTHGHHASSGSATMDYAHSIHAHSRQGNKSPASRPATTDISGPFSPHTDSPWEDSAFLGTNLKRGSLPWSNSGVVSPENDLPTRDTIKMSENIGSVPHTHQGFGLPTTCGLGGRRTFWKEGTHGSGAWRLCEGNKYKSPMKSLHYSSSELALLILVAFTKRTPSYADTPSCSSENLVKVHLANRLQPPECTKATPLAVHCILVDIEAVCGVSHLADPSPRSLAQHKGESIGVEKKQRL